jgi:hypothetical protein
LIRKAAITVIMDTDEKKMTAGLTAADEGKFKLSGT